MPRATSKGLLERVGAAVEFRPAEEFGLLRGRTAALMTAGEEAGFVGQAHPQLAARFDIQGPAFLFDIDVERLLAAVSTEVSHKAPSRFPAVMQDIALVVDGAAGAAKVHEIIESSALVARADLFDVYEGAPLPEGKRSLAYAVQFQAPDRTLTEAEVADARRRIIRRLEREVGAELRGAG